MSRVPRPLAELLLEAHLVSPEMLAAMGELQRRDDRRLGSLLLERRLISAERLAQLLSKQLSIPWVSLQKVAFDAALLRLIPKRIAVRHRVIPVYLRKSGTQPTLYVATDDPTRADTLRACREATGLPVRCMVAAPEEVRGAIEAHYGRPSRGYARAVDGVSRRSRPPARRPPLPRTAPTIESDEESWIAEDAVHAAEDEAPSVPPSRGDASADAVSEARARETRARAITEPPDADPASDAEAPPRVEAATSKVAMPVVQPTIVVVSADEGLASDCRAIGASLGAEFEAATLSTLQTRVVATRPIVILVSDEVYEFDPPRFNMLAIGADAHLVVWSRSLPFEDLEPVLEAAVRRARAALAEE